MIRNVLKKTIGWTSIIYFLYSIYLHVDIFVEKFRPLTPLYQDFNIGWIIGLIVSVGFRIIAIIAIYVWHKEGNS